MSDHETTPSTDEPAPGAATHTDEALAVGYRLALSRLRLRTTRKVVLTPASTATHADAVRVRVTYRTAVDVVVLADPRHRRPFPTDHATGREHDLSLTLGEDERLQTLSVDSTGIGPRLVSAGAQLLGVVVGGITGLGGLSRLAGVVGAMADGEATDRLAALVPVDLLSVLKRGAAAGTDLEEHRRRLERAIADAEQRVVDGAIRAAEHPDDVSQNIVVGRVERELARLRRLHERVSEDLARRAAAHTTEWEETDEACLFIRDLPPDPAPEPGEVGLPVSLATLGDRAGWDANARAIARDMLGRFGTLVCVRDAEEPAEVVKHHVPDRVGGGRRPIAGVPLTADRPATPRLIARAPRAVEAALYTPVVPDQTIGLSHGAGDIDLRLVRRQRVLIVDEFSDHIGVPLTGAGLFGKSVLNVSVGELGALTGLSSSRTTGAPEAAAGALGGLTTGVASVREFLGALDQLSDRPTERELERLRAQRERAELDRAIHPAPPDPREAERRRLLEDIDMQRQMVALQRELAELRDARAHGNADPA